MPAPGDPSVRTARLELLWLSPETMRALLAGTVGELGGAAVPSDWVEEMRPRLRMRLAQVERQPERAVFLLRAMIDRRGRELVGHIGFHGPPGANALGAADALELGYTVRAPFRRQGYATEAVLALIAWAERSHGIRRFLASIAPANVASLGLAYRLGFAEVGRVIDDEDGEEIVFELRRPGGSRAGASA